MPVWNVTGKLGGGKTLYAVHIAFEYLRAGRIVASNLDLFPEKVLGPWTDKIRLIRVPDHPAREDLDIIGIGNESTDESKNGLLIIDECGAILNARTFNAKGRDELIRWFVHARKLGWDIIFISQSAAMLDKQIRDSLVEYVTAVKRFDRYSVPLLSSIGIKIKLPRCHYAVTRYGTSPSAVVAERTFFRGTDLFDAYSTRQILDGKIIDDAGPHSILSPWHLKVDS